MYIGISRRTSSFSDSDMSSDTSSDVPSKPQLKHKPKAKAFGIRFCGSSFNNQLLRQAEHQQSDRANNSNSYCYIVTVVEHHRAHIVAPSHAAASTLNTTAELAAIPLIRV
jgi:hypothetical protein